MGFFHGEAPLTRKGGQEEQLDGSAVSTRSLRSSSALSTAFLDDCVRVRACAKLIRNAGKHRRRAYFLVGRSYSADEEPRSVLFSREPSYIWPRDVFQFGRRYYLRYFMWISLSPPPLSPPSLLLLRFFLVLRPPPGRRGSAKGCAWVVWRLTKEGGGGGGIREARRRLVRCGTLSLKYPEVFFPRNCRSPSFLASLNGPGYPGRIEKLPLHALSLSLSHRFFYLAFSRSHFFSFVSPREAIYTRLRLANSRPLLDDDKAPRALRTRPSLHAPPRVFKNLSSSAS